MNRLTHNTLACFEYFQKLWEHLQRQLEYRRDERFKEQRELKKICGAVEAIVEGTDRRLRGLCNYQRQLRDGACHLLHHIESLVGRIPPPLLIDGSALVCDPMVRTLLSDIDTVQRLFIANRHIRYYFDAVHRHELFAILFLRHQEKTILGTELCGDILQRDVQQTVFRCYAHRLVAPSPTEEAVRIELMISLFEDVVRHIKSQILEQKKHLMKRYHKDSVDCSQENLNNPDVFIKILVKQLSAPDHLITFHDKLIRVDRMGIKIPLDSSLPSTLLRLHELQIGDHHSQVVKIIRYPRNGFSDRETLRQAAIEGYGLGDNSCRI